MRALFLPSTVQQQQFNLEDVPQERDEPGADADLFLDSDAEVLSQSEDEVNFAASDAEEQNLALVPAGSSSKRPYATRRKDAVKFLGQMVCVRSACRLLGVGQDTLQRLRAGQPGYKPGKKSFPTHPQFGFSMRGDVREKWPAVVMYLWLVYHSSAECLPTDPGHRLLKPDNPAESPFPEMGQNQDDDELDRRVNAFMTSLNTYKTDVDVHLVGPGTFKGERRELQQLGFEFGSLSFFSSRLSVFSLGHLCAGLTWLEH